jgi:HEAT repeat protein
LIQIGKEHVADAIPKIAETLSNEDPRVRRTAALALGRFGTVAQSAVPALRRALGDDDQEVRINASDALLSILPLPPAQ